MSSVNEAVKMINAIPDGWKALVNIGYPMVMSFILLGAFFAERYGYVQNADTQTYSALMKSHQALLDTSMKNNAALEYNRNMIETNGNQQRSLSLAICLNTAKSHEERFRCQDALK